MAEKFERLSDKLISFIERQHMFFTASAAEGTHVNISPRSTDLFRVLGPSSVVYLDRTGSGNETAAHLKNGGRMTIMFCSVEGPPLILRLYGEGRILHRASDDYQRLLADKFANQPPLGARQMVQLEITWLQTSCGFGVPMFDYKEERPSMDNWAIKKGEDGIRDYWQTENETSLDGLPTGLNDTQ